VSGAARAAASSAASIVPGSTDTGAGYVAVASTKSIVGGTETDTVCLAWSNGAADTTQVLWLRGSKVWTVGVTDVYSLTPAAGRTIEGGRSWMENRRFLPAGEVQHVRMLVDPGADGSYDTQADNHVWSLAWDRTLSGDTLARASVASLDTSRPLTGDTGTTTFSATVWEGTTLLHPLQRSRTWNVVAKVTGSDTSVLSMSAVRVGIYGRIDSVTARNADGSAYAAPGDTAILRHVVQFANPTDTLVSETSTLKVRLVAGLGKTGNFLEGITSDRVYRLGGIAGTAFTWTAITEVPAGSAPVDGTILLVATLTDGKTATLSGKFAGGVIDATWTAPDGTVTTIQQAGK
jgi:hypothetical protein